MSRLGCALHSLNMKLDGVDAEQIVPTGKAEPTPARLALERKSPFRVIYLSMVVLLLLYIYTVKAVETSLRSHFEDVVAESVTMDLETPVPSMQIKALLDARVKGSPWIRIGEARAFVVVLAKDQASILYVDGKIPPVEMHAGRTPAEWAEVNANILPPVTHIRFSVPHNTMLSNSILILYASLFFTILYLYYRGITELEDRVIAEAVEARDDAAESAVRIEHEIERLRDRALEVEPSDQEHREEVGELHTERRRLERELAALAVRERELRGQAGLARKLEEETRALENLLEEATSDLDAKDEEINQLMQNLKRANRSSGGAAGSARGVESLGKRLRTLYSNLEFDDRAIESLVALENDSVKLRAEECIKRLSEDAENVGIRRKMGGLPKHLSIYEIGFAGKRRIYYMKGEKLRFRILLIGAKNTQESDVGLLARLPNPNELEVSSGVPHSQGRGRKGRSG